MNITTTMRKVALLVLAHAAIIEIGCCAHNLKDVGNWSDVSLPPVATSDELRANHEQHRVVHASSAFDIYAVKNCWQLNTANAPGRAKVLGQPLYELAILDSSDDVTFIWLQGTQPGVSDQGGSFDAGSTGTSFIVGRFHDHADSHAALAHVIIYADSVTAGHPISVILHAADNSKTQVDLSAAKQFLAFMTQKQTDGTWVVLQPAQVKPQQDTGTDEGEAELRNDFVNRHTDLAAARWLVGRATNVKGALQPPTSKP